MKKKVFLWLLGVIAAVLAVCSLLVGVAFSIREKQETVEYLQIITLKAAQVYEETGDLSLIVRLTDADRVTLIGEGGAVVFDSVADPKEMENHGDRQEVRVAQEGLVFVAERRSETLSTKQIYSATRLSDGSVLRLAKNFGGLGENLGLIMPAIAASALITLVVSVVIARTFSESIVRPLEHTAEKLAQGSFASLAESFSSYYEIDRIVYDINKLVREIARSKEDLQREKDKIQFILAKMAEGFILLDGDGNITLINDSAKEIFGWNAYGDPETLDLLRGSEKISGAVTEAASRGTSSIFDLELGGKTYSVHVARVFGSTLSEEGRSVSVLIIDVTAERQSQKMRSEFFSNASHELKTPVTSILGFAEMLDSGLLSEEDRKNTYTRIKTETRRIAELISDILTISELEGGRMPEDEETVVLSEVARDVAEMLKPTAEALGVTVSVKGGEVRYRVSRRKIHDLIRNLAENAVKYNKKGGTVEISTYSTANDVVIEVSDTGIGIPEKAQSRIFERFYRVDQGRSRSVGGTGLGLAIVKHITLSLGGEILLESRENVGTKITVKLPYKKPAEKYSTHAK